MGHLDHLASAYWDHTLLARATRGLCANDVAVEDESTGNVLTAIAITIEAATSPSTYLVNRLETSWKAKRRERNQS